MEKVYDMLIIGGGPAGYTAALYAARAGMQVLLLEKLSAGGQMALSEQIDNYPGFVEGIDGFVLAEQMQQQAERFGARTVLAEVNKLELTGEIKLAHTSQGVYRGKTVIIATGANPKKLDIPGEQALAGQRIHYCAACDGMRYKGKTVMVIGGGDSAAADALQLSRIAQRVIIVHRRDTLKATKIYHAPLMEAENVEFLWNRMPIRLDKEEEAVRVTVENRITGQEEQVLCHGVFVSVGRAPATGLVEDGLALDGGGYILADESTKTSVAGVLAVGDVRTKSLRQVVTAVADGAVAVHFAQEYLAEKG